MTDLLGLDFDVQPGATPTGNSERFGGRWRLVGAGLSNVWRYGDLDLPAPSGRLLLRGPNGTGKTTALEALWPYLLDLNAAKLAAGKARPTTLKLLMSEGAGKGRRYGYAWLTFASARNEPADALSVVNDNGSSDDLARFGPLVSFGVRLQYSPNSSPAVKVVPFIVPGRPLHDIPLHGSTGTAFEIEEFSARIHGAGGQVFADRPEDYVDALAARIWRTTADELRLLAGRMREVRNPTLLGDVSPAAAANALRESLPGVSEDVLSATAEALAESDATREAFQRDAEASRLLTDFATAWTGHVVDVTRAAHIAAAESTAEVSDRGKTVDDLTGRLLKDGKALTDAETLAATLDKRHKDALAQIRAIELSAVYQAHGRVTDLRATLKAQLQTATSRLDTLRQTAAQAERGTRRSRSELDERVSELHDLIRTATEFGAPAESVETLLTYRDRPRSTYRVADIVVDPGPGLTLTHDPTAHDALESRWRTLAANRTRDADSAQLALRDHKSVAAAQETAVTLATAAATAESEYDDAHQAAQRAANEATSIATACLSQVRNWAPNHPWLRGVTEPSTPDLTSLPVTEVAAPEEPTELTGGPGEDLRWGSEDLDEIADSEPALVLSVLDQWADLAVRLSERIAAADEQAAANAISRAKADEGEAQEHRSRAQQLRSGQLMPLPQPHWSGPSDDTLAFGSVLEWAPSMTDAGERALIELALADAGVLGAHLTVVEAIADHWRISPEGPPQDSNLTQVLTVDDEHPHAETARAVLTRISLVDTAHPGTGTVSIGRDGTFASGPLTGNPVAARTQSGQAVPSAVHIGARSRQIAALAEAARREGLAEELERQAALARATALSRRAHASQIRTEAGSFPEPNKLRSAESKRVQAAADEQLKSNRARESRDKAKEAQAHFEEVRTEWTERVRELGLPTDLTELRDLMAVSREQARELIRCADRLTGGFSRSLARILDNMPEENDLAATLTQEQTWAREAHDDAQKTRATLEEATQVGDTDDALERHERTTHDATALSGELEQARGTAQTARDHVKSWEAKLEEAHERLKEAKPAQVIALGHLGALLGYRAVAEALDLPAPLPDTEDLPKFTEQVLSRRPGTSRRLLGDKYDDVRARLAQTWTIARGEPVAGLEDLDVYVLTHSETQYSPVTAGTRARQLAERAEQALAEAEATALRDFVIGRLPSAIGTAWIRLQDWKLAVNSKMRSAQASSGVGVQVQVQLSEDLSPAAHTVYELSCRVSDADRTEQQKSDVGQALTALLDAADGETMLERLNSAVDIRSWVDVHYLVERPGPDGRRTSRRWSSKTGLSGGERRLVVLAPMLAAIAASYDRLSSTGLRLVPLDEVPAEVDERGREGLARYIAELDLDLLCTSYLWDGSPGAWDGIDAHDLEAGADGTVVAFPMLVRGVDPLPGDDPTDEIIGEQRNETPGEQL